LRREWHPAQTFELLRVQWRDALGDARRGVHLPLVAVNWLEPGCKPHPAGLQLRVWLRLRRSRAFGDSRLGPGDVVGARAVARLAGDVYIGPAGGVGIRSEIIVLLQIRGMAARALIVPGLVSPGPMEAVTGSQDLVRVKAEPALTTPILERLSQAIPSA
jgi:hypothetical protein